MLFCGYNQKIIKIYQKKKEDIIFDYLHEKARREVIEEELEKIKKRNL